MTKKRVTYKNNNTYMQKQDTSEVQETAPQGFSCITEALSYLQCRLVARKNKTAKGKTFSFDYRSAEDVLAAIKPITDSIQAAVTMSDNIITVNNRTFVQATATFRWRDQTISEVAFAELPEYREKMDISQSTGTSSSYARKYALGGLLALDDSKNDPDALHQDRRQGLTNDQWAIVNKAKTEDELTEACKQLMKQGVGKPIAANAFRIRWSQLNDGKPYQKPAPAKQTQSEEPVPEQPTEEPQQLIIEG